MNTEINEALSGGYLLVDITLRQWSGRRLDKAAGAEVEVSKGALSGATRVTKDLMAGSRVELKLVAAYQNMVRGFLNSNTLPWSSSKSGKSTGSRLLATAKSIEFLTRYKQLVAQYDVALAGFISVYDDRRQQAMANLGQLADSKDYPDALEIAGEFAIELNINPVPSTSDFSRLTLPAELSTVLANRLAKQHDIATTNAMHNLHDRVVEQLNRVVSTTNKLAAGESTNVRDSLIGNLKTIVGLLRASNITNSVKVVALASRIETELLMVDSKQLRSDTSLASDVNIKAKALIEQVEIDNIFY